MNKYSHISMRARAREGESDEEDAEVCDDPISVGTRLNIMVKDVFQNKA